MTLYGFTHFCALDIKHISSSMVLWGFTLNAQEEVLIIFYLRERTSRGDDTIKDLFKNRQKVQ